MRGACVFYRRRITQFGLEITIVVVRTATYVCIYIYKMFLKAYIPARILID